LPSKIDKNAEKINPFLSAIGMNMVSSAIAPHELSLENRKSADVSYFGGR